MKNGLLRWGGRFVVVLILEVTLTVATAYAFDNPDGPAGSVCLTPFYSYAWLGDARIRLDDSSGEASPPIPGFDSSSTSWGLSITVPTAPRVTLFGKFRVNKWEQSDIIDFDGAGGADTKVTNIGLVNYSVGISLKLYIGGK